MTSLKKSQIVEQTQQLNDFNADETIEQTEEKSKEWIA